MRDKGTWQAVSGGFSIREHGSRYHIRLLGFCENLSMGKDSRSKHRSKRLRLRLFRQLETERTFVDHPRFGDKPIVSGANFSREEIIQSFWQYSRAGETIFSETAILADTTKQNYHCFPRKIYVDLGKKCRECGKWFIFYALEQKYWFEHLGFFVDADCVYCAECRRNDHQLKGRIERYNALVKKRDKSTEEWRELSVIADVLWEVGYIRKPETLRKSRPPKRLEKRHE